MLIRLHAMYAGEIMQISNNGLRLIEGFEGFVSCPYWDPYGRVYTRGYGETEGISRSSKCLTQKEAQENLRKIFTERYAPSINNLGVPLNQNQFDALGSFVWNLGPGSMEWDVGRSLRAGQYGQAAYDMLQYDRAGGVVLAGLASRRRQEVDLFRTPIKPTKPKNPLDVLYPAERRVVNSYLAYIKHPRLHPHGLKVTREKMTAMRKNIYDAAVYGRLENGTKVKKGWNINNRKSRYELLKKYTS